MKRFILTVGMGLLAAAIASPSIAADVPRPIYKAPAVPYVAPFTWSGFYIGINGGYGWGDAEISNVLGNFTTDTQDGWLIGGTVGYNVQTGNWVWGIEGDFDAALIKGNTSNTIAIGPCAVGGCTVKDTWFATARGRIGYAWNRFMPYITGGGAFAGLKVESPAGSSSDTATGWTFGGGVEWAFTSAWSAKLEYLYADLGKTTCDATVCGFATDVEPKLNIVRAGINYRF
jgi:outer membrane immunogenic protein